MNRPAQLSWLSMLLPLYPQKLKLLLLRSQVLYVRLKETFKSFQSSNSSSGSFFPPSPFRHPACTLWWFLPFIQILLTSLCTWGCFGVYNSTKDRPSLLLSQTETKYVCTPLWFMLWKRNPVFSSGCCNLCWAADFSRGAAHSPGRSCWPAAAVAWWCCCNVRRLVIETSRLQEKRKVLVSRTLIWWWDLLGGGSRRKLRT